MPPITNKSQIICKNCVYGTRESSYQDEIQQLYCEKWDRLERFKSCCGQGMFLTKTVSLSLSIMSYDQALKELPDATRD